MLSPPRSNPNQADQSEAQLRIPPTTPATATTTEIARDDLPGREAPLRLVGAGVAGQMHSESSGRSWYVTGTQQGHSTRASTPPDYFERCAKFAGGPKHMRVRVEGRRGRGGRGVADMGSIRTCT